MSALVFQLTGNPILVGAVPAILRFGWLFPQLFVGFLAARSGASMRYYVIGAFGRTAAIGVLAAVIWLGAGWPAAQLGVAVLLIWTVAGALALLLSHYLTGQLVSCVAI